jgi:hypothetical protein
MFHNSAKFLSYLLKSRDSSVGIATRLLAGLSGFYGSISGGGREFFLSLPRPDHSGAHLTSYPMGTGVSLGVKRPGRETDYSPPSTAEIKNAWSYTSTPIRIRGVVLS